MPIEKEITITRQITAEVTETKLRILQVDILHIRANGPDAGEVFGHTNILEDGQIVDGFDWVVPKEQALPVGMANGLYALMQKTLYSFAQVTQKP